MTLEGSKSKGPSRRARLPRTDDPDLFAPNWEARYLAIRRLGSDRASDPAERARALVRCAADEHHSCRQAVAIGLTRLASAVMSPAGLRNPTSNPDLPQNPDSGGGPLNPDSGGGPVNPDSGGGLLDPASDPSGLKQQASSLPPLTPEDLLPPLAQLLNDPDPWVRLRAAQGLGVLRSRDAAEKLAARIRLEADLRVRATLVKALGGCGDARYVDLVTALLYDPDPRVRANAVEGLGCYANPLVAEVLLPYLDDPAPRVRSNTARVLLPFNRARAIGTFKSLARASDPGARASAAFALAAASDPAGLALLIDLAQDPVPAVRENAVEALGAHGKAAETALLALLTSPAAAVRAAACDGLARVGGRASVAPLAERTEDGDGFVRAAAGRALMSVEGRLGNRRMATAPVGAGRGKVDG